MGGGSDTTSSSGDHGVDLETFNKAEVLVMVTILISLAFHSCFDYLEEKLHRHRSLALMLHHLYKELLVLGFTSFVLFVFEMSEIHLNADDKHIFEIVHMTLFFIVIGYSVVSLGLMGLSFQMSKKWEILERHEKKDFVRVQKIYDALAKEKKSMSWWSWRLSFKKRRRYNKYLEQLSYHHMRMNFIHSNHLDRDFSFSTYLRKCCQHVFLRLTEVHKATWIFLICIMCLDVLQRDLLLDSVFHGYITDDVMPVTALAGALLCLAPLLIFRKIRKIFKLIIESELIKFDPIAARFFFKHWHGEEDGGRELSVSYTDSQNQKHHLKLTPEQVHKTTTRKYRLESWGNQHDKPKNQEKEDWREKQLSLFWFNSHEFIIYLLQSLLFLFVFYYAIVLQFPEYFLNFDTGLHTLGTVVRLLPLPIFLYCVPRLIPDYSIIINIGQMVDLKVVAEAVAKSHKKKKNKKKATKRGHGDDHGHEAQAFTPTVVALDARHSADSTADIPPRPTITQQISGTGLSQPSQPSSGSDLASQVAQRLEVPKVENYSTSSPTGPLSESPSPQKSSVWGKHVEDAKEEIDAPIQRNDTDIVRMETELGGDDFGLERRDTAAESVFGDESQGSVEDQDGVESQHSTADIPLKKKGHFQIYQVFFSKRMASITIWGSVISLAIYGMMFVQSLSKIWLGLRVLNCAIASVFLVELIVKTFAVVFIRTIRDQVQWWHFLDGITVIVHFAATLIVIMKPSLRALEILVILRLFSAIQIKKTNKVIMKEVDKELDMVVREHRASVLTNKGGGGLVVEDGPTAHFHHAGSAPVSRRNSLDSPAAH